MFPVVGWTVSERSLVGVGADGSRPAAKPSLDEGFPRSRPGPKKRKRDEAGPHSQTNVTGDELQRLWESQVPAEPGNRARLSTKKRRRESRQSSELAGQSNSTVNGENQTRQSISTVSERDQDPVLSAKSGAAGRQAGGKKYPQGSVKRRNGKKSGRQGEKKLGSNPPKNADAAQHGRRRSSPEHQLPPSQKLTPLQAKMRGKLTSARFRHLNELLYTSASSAALELFTSSPDLFSDYHDGFLQQVKSSWPANPVDEYIKEIKARAPIDFKMGKAVLESDPHPLPRRKTGSCTIADLGCGDAPLARAFAATATSLDLKFHSFDLHAANQLVKVADIADLPLRDGEADLAVFCLSLMGTNWVSFVEEAWRVLRGDGKGELWIAEVKSRFGRKDGKKLPCHHIGRQKKRKGPSANRSQHGENAGTILPDEEEPLVEEAVMPSAVGAAEDDTDLSAFINVVQRRGFSLRPASVQKRNKMFVSMVFTKADIPLAGKHRGLKWDGHRYKMINAGGGEKGRKFIDRPSHSDAGTRDPGSEEAEDAKVLKPCLYKKR